MEKNPELVKHFVAAMQDGLDALNNDREKTVDLLYKEYFNKIDPAVWKLIMDTNDKGIPDRSLTFSEGDVRHWTQGRSQRDRRATRTWTTRRSPTARTRVEFDGPAQPDLLKAPA